MLTSRACSCRLRSGFARGGAATSHTLMLPSPHADASMFSFVSLHAQSYSPSTVSKPATSCMPWGVTCISPLM